MQGQIDRQGIVMAVGVPKGTIHAVATNTNTPKHTTVDGAKARGLVEKPLENRIVIYVRPKQYTAVSVAVTVRFHGMHFVVDMMMDAMQPKEAHTVMAEVARHTIMAGRVATALAPVMREIYKTT